MAKRLNSSENIPELWHPLTWSITFLQEDYLSERNYEEPLDEDSAYRLLNFGDDYRNYLDSLSEGPASCSERTRSNHKDNNNGSGGSAGDQGNRRHIRRTRRYKVRRNYYSSLVFGNFTYYSTFTHNSVRSAIILFAFARSVHASLSAGKFDFLNTIPV